MPAPIWHLEGNLARLNLPGVSAVVDAARPGEGLGDLTLADRAWPGTHLLGVGGPVLSAPEVSLAELLVRAESLQAAYEIRQPEPARIDIAWRASSQQVDDVGLAQVDLMVSIRTESLDWRHDLYIESAQPAADVEPVGDLAEARDFQPCLHFVRPEAWSYAEMVHPDDLRQNVVTTSQPSDGIRIRHRLFRPESLEKGVILRARARGIIAPSALDRQLAERLYAEFLAADPPLGN